MLVLRHVFKATLILLCLVMCGSELLQAQTPTTWWPDPKTGLMWTGQVATLPHGQGMNWNQATAYCASLQLTGYSGWRLPTVDEIKAITYTQHVIPVDRHYLPYDSPELKGNINGDAAGTTWTKTMSGTNEAWIASFWNGHHMNLATTLNSALLTEPVSTLCVRVMDPELLQIATDADVSKPVPDLLTLNAYVPLTNARHSYQSGNFHESIAQAQQSLKIKPDFAAAYWAIGISYGRLGQWDQATTNLDASLKIDKNYDIAKTSLKWVKDAKEAAQKGKNPKIQPPQWN